MGVLRLTPVQEALSAILSRAKPTLKVERVSLGEALGRVLGVDVVAPMDLPPYDRSAVDGYAVKAQDTFNADEESPVKLRLAFKVSMGSPPPGVVKQGECAYVATGSMLPMGCDAVVMVEYVKEQGEWIEVYRAVAPGENVVKKGSEASKGSKILSKGTKLAPQHLGLLASIGLGEVEVVAKPRIAVASTGVELIEPGRPLEEGKVYDVNSTTLSAMAREAGCEVVSLGIVPDEVEAMVKALRKAASISDLVLMSGGTSKGEGDLLPRALARLPEAEVLIHGLALKPGKPTIIALIGNKPLIGLPGNPTSAMAVFHVLVKPLILHMLGAREVEVERSLEAKMGLRAHSARGRRELLFVKLKRNGEGWKAYPMPTGSEAASTYAKADGYVEVPEEVEILEEGEPVIVKLLK